MRKSATKLTMILCATCLFFLITPELLAVTGDSASWEGKYEADTLPSVAGFSCPTYNEATYASVADGVLTIDTILVPGGNDVAVSFQKDAPFNLANGASVEWRVKLVTYDTWNIWASSLLIADSTNGGAVVACGSPIETYTSAGIVAHSGFPTFLEQWNTVRLTAKNGIVSLYINGVLDSVSLGGPSSSWVGLGLNAIRFGDVTGENDATTQIDYVRWTTAGAFAPIVATYEDSSTWEGKYEADTLPSVAGFTCVTGNEATYASVADGVLTVDTIYVPSSSDDSIFFQKDAAFNLADGASVEWRVKLITYDSWNLWASSLLIADNVNGGAVVAAGSPIETYTSAGLIAHSGFPTGLDQWNTVRLTAKNGVVNLYINGVLDSVSLGGPNNAWVNGGLNLVRFGDCTGANDAITEIDYIRWTTAGAFAPPAVTEDSTTWEGQYNADALPTESGFTCPTDNEETYASVSDGILAIDTMGSDDSVAFDRSGPFNLTDGASVEWRIKTISYDDPMGGFLNSALLNIFDATSYITVDAYVPVQTNTSAGIIRHPNLVAPQGQFNVVRMTAKNGVVKLYVNGQVDDIDLGGPYAGAILPPSIRFGDVTAVTDAAYEIDYIRWTSRGAFALPLHEPTYCGDINTEYFIADISGPTGRPDCAVNLYDLAKMGEEWLKCTMPGQSGCSPVESILTIPQGTAIVNGDISEWFGAEWIALDKPYWNSTPDVDFAKFSLRWNNGTHKIYAAVEVKDSSKVFENYPPSNWYTSDRLEIYSQGDAAGGTGFGSTFKEAQQYWVSKNPTGEGSWATLAALPVPSTGLGNTGLEYAVVRDDISGTTYYEIGVPQYDYYDPAGVTSQLSNLQVGKEIGFDIVVGSAFYDDLHMLDFGMLSENRMGGKSDNADMFAKYILTDAIGSGLSCGDWGYLISDISSTSERKSDCSVNFTDFAQMALQWLSCSDPANPNCDIYWR